MQLRKSFVMRMFMLLLAFFLLLMTLSSIGVYRFSQQVVGEEFLRLNKTSLSYLAASAGVTLEEMRSFSEKLAVNSRILELSSENSKNARQAVHDILVQQQSEFNTAHLDGSALMEAYVITENGLNVSAYNSGRYTWDTICEDQAFQPLLKGETDFLLLPTSVRLGTYGIMGHTLQLAVPMRDLFTGDFRGVVLLDISETALYRQFRRFQGEQVTIRVIDGQGRILSAQNKSQIGHMAEYDVSRLEQMKLKNLISGDHILIYEQIPQSQWFLVMQMPTNMAFGTLTKVRNVTLMIAAGCSGAAVLLFLLLAHRMMKRINRIRDKMGNVVDGDLSVRIPVEKDDELAEIESAFNIMVEEISRLIEKARQSEQQKLIAQMDFLHAQINSHFIHNTLTSIRFMLEMDRVKEAGEMIYYFSRLLRQTLSHSTEFISLREEMDTLKSYVMLQSYRYQNTFEATFDFAEETLEVPVPVLILQPVVENAIFHGASHHYSHIAIRSRRQGGQLILTVEDDGQGIPEEKLRAIFQKDASLNRVGLRNVHQRIQLIYGEEYGLTIESREGKGTVVCFTLPMNTEGEMHREA